MPVPDPFGQQPLYVDPVTGARSRSALSLGPRGLDLVVAAAVLAGRLDPGRSLFLGLERVPLDPRVGRASLGTIAERELLAALESATLAVAPPGAADLSLSGGLDSSLLAALLARAQRAGRAYTLLADDDTAGEASRAAALCARLGLEHVLVPVRGDELPARFEQAVLAAEAPLWNGKAVASLAFFAGCRSSGARTLVSGCGADDVLAGQPEALRASHGRAARERRLAETVLLESARQGLPRDAVPARGLLEAQARWLATVLPESTLVPECRLSAAAGVSVRLPYLQPDFAALALALPKSQRAHGAWGKWLLRRAAEELLPRELCWQPKQPRLWPAGGGSPRARELWTEGLAAWLSVERLAALQVVDARATRALLDRCAAGALPAGEREPADALLLRLASLTILQAAVDRRRGLADARPREED